MLRRTTISNTNFSFLHQTSTFLASSRRSASNSKKKIIKKMTTTTNHQYDKQYHVNGGDNNTSTVIHWFRKGLRLHDNPGLLDAVNNNNAKSSNSFVLPVFIIDPHFANPEYVGVNRYRFLLETLADLDETLQTKTNSKSRLLVARGNPSDVLPKLAQQWNAKKVTWEYDTEPYARERDAKLTKTLEQKNIEVKTFVSHTLYEPSKVMKLNPNGEKGLPTTSYGAFCGIVGRLGKPAEPANTQDEILKMIKDMNSSSAASNNKSLISISKNSKDAFSVPTLKELGYPDLPVNKQFPGGETEALARFKKNVAEKAAWVRNFSKPETAPNSLEPSTTTLSPYLKFGCLSPRLFYHELLKIEQKGTHTSPPTSLRGQLLWREFNYYSSYATPNYHSMTGNPNCRNIPWGNDKKLLDAWKEGRTGFPFIDAIMIQLREEGWIHHLARHAVACFLTRGDLWQHWEEGAKVFDLYLLDADYALNNSNWMWLSASCFFYQYFRCYSPIEFGKKTDKKGEYIRKYIPALRKFPDKFIFEPWKAPTTLQHACGCIIGKDYPKPIVDHATVSKENMSKMAAAYEAHKNKGTTTRRARSNGSDDE